MSFSFFGILYFSILFAFSAYLLFPELKKWLDTLVPSQIPEFHTWDFFIFILTNNAAHFFNPLKMLVWIPLLGSFFLGMELALNSLVIGAVIAYAGMEKGALFTIIGIIPHGIFEIPAFIFQFVCFARLHITTLEWLHAKIIGEKFEKVKVITGLKDTAIFAVIALILFVVAALIETFVTPAILDSIFGKP
ncbi:MAG: stage II sporulation protein M [Candidatus Bathyarchaeia archaeon]|nr:stage II sporulation protein M [Candidatus Bathyarchaeia archaeon]